MPFKSRSAQSCRERWAGATEPCDVGSGTSDVLTMSFPWRFSCCPAVCLKRRGPICCCRQSPAISLACSDFNTTDATMRLKVDNDSRVFPELREGRNESKGCDLKKKHLRPKQRRLMFVRVVEATVCSDISKPIRPAVAAPRHQVCLALQLLFWGLVGLYLGVSHICSSDFAQLPNSAPIFCVRALGVLLKPSTTYAKSGRKCRSPCVASNKQKIPSSAAPVKV